MVERQCKKEELEDFRQKGLGGSIEEGDGKYAVIDRNCKVGDCNYSCELHLNIRSGKIVSTSLREDGSCQLEEYD